MRWAERWRLCESLYGHDAQQFCLDRPVEWMNNWTLFFWAWWVDGRRLSACFWRVSRAGVPFAVRAGHVDYSVYLHAVMALGVGNSALYEIIHGGAAFAEEARSIRSAASTACWRSIRRLPLRLRRHHYWPAVLCDLGGLRGLVLGNFTSQLKDINSDAPGCCASSGRWRLAC